MIVLKIIALYLVLTYVFYRTGLIINKFIKNNNIIQIILYGFVANAGALQIIYVPLILIHVSFNIVLYITLFLEIAIFCISFFCCPIAKEKEIILKSIKTIKREILLNGIIITIVVIEAAVSCFVFNENADDSFYVSLIEQNKNSNSIYSIDPSLGTDNTTHLSNYYISGHELALSVVSKVFFIPSAILCHTVIIFGLIIFSYMAYWILLRKLMNNKKSKVALILLSILFLFSGFTTRFRGIILFSRMWQGKEIFLNIIMTLILSNLIKFRKLNRKISSIKLLILNFAAIFFTNTAIFIVTFTYAAFGIIQLVQKKWKNIFALLLTGIPIAIYGIIYLCVAKNMQAAGTVNYMNIIKDYFGTGYYYILYILSLIIIFFKGNRTAKQYFLIIPAINLITIYNPFLTGIIVKYFTGANVYWRLLWILPVEISIVYAFTILDFSIKKKTYKASLFTLEIILLIVCGKFVFTHENGFEKPENLSKIPEPIVYQTQFILEKEKNLDRQINVMAPPEPLHSVTMRQLTSSVNLFWSREHYMKQLYTSDELEKINKIYSIYSKDEISIEKKEFEKILDDYKINWIIIDNMKINVNKFLKTLKYKEKYDMYGYTLYQF